jgi:hypothetical protein
LRGYPAGLFLGAWVAGGLYALLGRSPRRARRDAAALGRATTCSCAEHSARIGRGGGDWISTCATIPGRHRDREYGVLVPALAGRPASVATALVLGLSAVLWRGVRWGDVVQQLTSLMKGLALRGSSRRVRARCRRARWHPVGFPATLFTRW